MKKTLTLIATLTASTLLISCASGEAETDTSQKDATVQESHDDHEHDETQEDLYGQESWEDIPERFIDERRFVEGDATNTEEIRKASNPPTEVLGYAPGVTEHMETQGITEEEVTNIVETHEAFVWLNNDQWHFHNGLIEITVTHDREIVDAIRYPDGEYGVIPELPRSYDYNPEEDHHHGHEH